VILNSKKYKKITFYCSLFRQKTYKVGSRLAFNLNFDVIFKLDSYIWNLKKTSLKDNNSNPSNKLKESLLFTLGAETNKANWHKDKTVKIHLSPSHPKPSKELLSKSYLLEAIQSY